MIYRLLGFLGIIAGAVVIVMEFAPSMLPMDLTPYAQYIHAGVGGFCALLGVATIVNAFGASL